MKEIDPKAPSILTDIQPESWFRGFLMGKTRILSAWIFAGLLLFFSQEYPTLPGVLLCFLGASLRYWASGFLRKDSRPAVGGPYAFTRNPLYLGTWLMAVGISLAIENLWLTLSVSILFAIVYHSIILDEETKLRRIFGEAYTLYCVRVSRFFPNPWRVFAFWNWGAHAGGLMQVNPELAHHRFSPELASRNRAMEAYYSFAGLVAVVCLTVWVKNALWS